MVALTDKIQLKKPDDGEYGWSQMLRDNQDTLDAITGLLRDERMLSGISTGGSATTLIDTALTMGIDAMKGASIIIRRDNQILRVETVLSNTATTFTFATGAALQLGDGYIVANQAILPPPVPTLPSDVGAEPADAAIQQHIQSPHAPSTAQANRAVSTSAQALAGTDNATDMTPLRVKEVVNANLPAINHGLNQGFKMIANTSKSAIGYRWMAAVTFNNEIVVWGRHDTTYLVMGHNANPIGFTTVQHHPSKEGVMVTQIEQFPWGLYVLYEDGDVYSLGYGAYNNLGIGNATDQRRLVFSISGVSVLSTSGIGHHHNYVHAMVVKTDGTVWGVGQNIYGQLGVSDNLNKSTWTQAALPTGETAVDVIAINTHVAMSIVRTTSGKLYTTGYNGYGQLGVGDVTNRNIFTLVRGLALETVVDVVSSGGGYNGDYRWCLNCLTQSGKVFTWGAGTWGDGIGGVAQHNLPTEIAYGHDNVADPIRTITHLSQGLYCCMSYITTNNDLYTWGYNGYGQLGDGTLVSKNSPTFIMAGVDFVHGSCGIYDDYYVTVHAKKLDGTVWGWGYSGYYNVGNAIAGNQSTPQQIWIPDSANIIQFSHCGYSVTYTIFALLADGRLYAWGDNAYATCSPLQQAPSTHIGTPTRVN